MNRRTFLSGLGALVGGIALEQAIPLGRVWSFPTEIKCVNANCLLTMQEITNEALKVLERRLKFATLAERQLHADALGDLRFVGGLQWQ